MLKYGIGTGIYCFFYLILEKLNSVVIDIKKSFIKKKTGVTYRLRANIKIICWPSTIF